MASTLTAGPEYKKAVAGPIPAPRVVMLAKSGSTVQEQTARMEPETDATEYERIFLACAPKYLMTEAFLMNTEMAPAIKKAGIRQSSTCSRA
jgi:hypothetical protein